MLSGSSNPIKSALDAIKRRWSTPGRIPPKPGLYHFDRQGDGYRSRIHLRIDPDQNAILMINANRVLHLNQTAAIMAWLCLNGFSVEESTRDFTSLFQVSPKQARQDIEVFYTQFEEIINPVGLCPIHDLDTITITAPFSARPSAPYRMDLALTYRCNNDCAHCYNARPRNYPEITTQAWKKIIDRTWENGIPHVVFTGGEPTLRDDLPELIAHAEQNGQITGLNTNGRRLSNSDYIQKLIDSGLDHVQITIESHAPQVHDRLVACRGAWQQTITGLQNALESPLFVMTNTTLLRENSPLLDDTLQYLASMGVPTVGLNALIYSGRGLTVGTGLNEDELPPLLELARKITGAHDQRLIWYTPTQYCNFDPMALELGIKGCTAALFNMCIEPDGEVLPCQSFYRSLGNILTNNWDSIWNHELSVYLRERKYIPQKCHGCSLLSECGGGCPLKIDGDQAESLGSVFDQ